MEDYFPFNAQPRTIKNCHISVHHEDKNIKYKFSKKVISEFQNESSIQENSIELPTMTVPTLLNDPMTKRRTQFVKHFNANPHISMKMINSEFQTSEKNTKNCYLGEWAFSDHHKYNEKEKNKSIKDIPMGLLCAYKLLDHHRVDIDDHIRHYSEFVKDHSDYDDVKNKMNSSSLWVNHFNVKTHLCNDEDLMESYDPRNLYHLLVYMGFGFKEDKRHQNIAIKNFMSSVCPKVHDSVTIRAISDLIDFIMSGVKMVHGNYNWEQNNQKNIFKAMGLDILIKEVLTQMSETDPKRVTFENHDIFT